MKAIEDLLTELRSLGVTVCVEGEQLRIRSKKGIISRDLQGRIKQHKTEILSLCQKAKQDDDIEKQKAAKIITVEKEKGICSIDQIILYQKEETTPSIAIGPLIPFSLRIKGPVVEEIVEKALRKILDRHEILRTIYVSNSWTVKSEILDNPRLPFTIDNISGINKELLDKEIDEYLKEVVLSPIKITNKQLPVKFHLLRLSKNEVILSFVFHHIAFDGWSFHIFMNELINNYTALLKGQSITRPALTHQYSDYLQWQQMYLQSQQFEQQLLYWKNLLDDTEIALKFSSNENNVEAKGVRKEIVFDEAISEKIESYCLIHKVTLFNYLLTAIALMLWQYTGELRFIILTPVAGRNFLEFEKTIGWFNKAIAFKVDLTKSVTIKEILEDNKKQIIGAHNNQNVPTYYMKQLINTFHPTQFCRVTFGVNNFPMDIESFHKEFMEVETIGIDKGDCQYDLKIAAAMGKRELGITITFNDTVFDDEEKRKVIELLRRFVNSLHIKGSNDRWSWN